MSDETTQSRTVEFLEVNTDMRNGIIEQVGHTEFYRAIGYLASWNLSYPLVRIGMYLPSEWPPEIGAVYFDANGKVQYTINAVFNRETGQFGFHS